jgi:hypothetical protein
MGTTIDELIVTLGLDSSKFSAGAKSAVEDLRKLEVSTKRAGKAVEDDFGKGLKSLLGIIKDPIGAAEKALFDFASTAKKATDTVTSGTKTAAGGMKDLSDASRKTKEEVVADTTAGSLGMRSLAGSALVAFAAFKALQGVLGGLQKQMQFAAATGYMAQWTEVSPEFMSRFSGAAYKKTGAPPEQTDNWLMQFQAGLTAFTSSSSVTQGQMNATTTALMRLGINPIEDKGKSNEEALSDILGKIEDKLKSASPSERTVIGQELGMPMLLAQFMSLGQAEAQAAMNAQKVVEVTKAEADAAQKLAEAERTTEQATSKLERILLVNLAPTLIKIFTIITNFLTALPKLGTATNNLANAHPAVTSTLEAVFPALKPFFWMLRKMKGDSDPNDPTNAPTGDMKLSGETSSESSMLDIIAQNESGNKNVFNYMHDKDPSYYTASGNWQITDTNWRAASAALGIDLAKYPSAISAPYNLQRQVALWMLRQQGSDPWDSAHGGSIPPGSFPANPSPSISVPSQIKAQQTSNSSTNTTNSGGNTMQNNINVTVPPGSSNSTGASVAADIHRQVVTTGMNAGFE